MGSELENYLSDHPDKEKVLARALAIQFRQIMIFLLEEKNRAEGRDVSHIFADQAAACQLMIEYFQTDTFGPFNLQHALNLAANDGVNSPFGLRMISAELQGPNQEPSPAILTLISSAIALLFEEAGIPQVAEAAR